MSVLPGHDASVRRRRPCIGVDLHTFDGIYQGSRSHLLGMYREAVALRTDIDYVFLLTDTERLRRAFPEFSAPHVRLAALPHGGGLARLGWQLAAAQWRERLDLLHVQYRLPLVPWGACACTIHDTLFETHPQYFSRPFVRMSRWTSRRAVGAAALLFTVSDYSRDEIIRLYGTSRERVTVTCNGVDDARFRSVEVDADGSATLTALGLVPGGYLLTVGRLEPRKNHLNLVRAYARLRGPRPPLVIVGQRDFGVDAVFDEVARLGLQSDVRFLDRVDDAALPALFRHAKVFVYPSYAEGFGMPVIEAMASGVPVVTSDRTALAEVAADAAVTVDPDDPAGIAAALQRLLDDPALCAEMSCRGLARAKLFNWRRSAEALVGAYARYFGLPPTSV